MQIIKTTIKKLLTKLPLPKKFILFESYPTFADNTKAVYDEMIRRGLNKKYKFVWVMFKKDEVAPSVKTKNVRFIRRSNRIKFFFFSLKAKALICCNVFLVPPSSKNFSIYLCHGNPMKNTRDYYLVPDAISYILASSDALKDIESSFYGYSKERIVPLGFPRNDVFSDKSINLHALFDVSFDKIIVWYPTFRQGTTRRHGGSHPLPIIWNEDFAKQINECAKRNRVLIVLKPHFAQDMSFLHAVELSNIVLINDDFFRKNGITSYQFVGSCDALLTDYSSIYYDYTLCDKPIGLIWEDYKEYEKSPGFAVDMQYIMKGGVKIYNEFDFMNFICDISKGVDTLQKERREIRDIVNFSTDGNNSKRVVDFIVEKARL